MRFGRTLVDQTPTAVAIEGDTTRILLTPLTEVMAGADARLGPPVSGRRLSPLTPGNVIGVGLNFADTVQQMGWDTPAEPYLFAKFASSVIGPDEPILVDPDVTTRVDWEGELAVIIGSRVKHIPTDRAMDAVFGYTVANDISARDLQASDGQWIRGKAMDTFCPLGPEIVAADEFGDPSNVQIRTWVDGEMMQDGRTADMIFEIPELISYISRFITLNPGDVILTGTPAGCGDFMTPARHLHPGAVVEVEVAGIGRLRNPVRTDPKAPIVY